MAQQQEKRTYDKRVYDRQVEALKGSIKSYEGLVDRYNRQSAFNNKEPQITTEQVENARKRLATDKDELARLEAHGPGQ